MTAQLMPCVESDHHQARTFGRVGTHTAGRASEPSTAGELQAEIHRLARELFQLAARIEAASAPLPVAGPELQVPVVIDAEGCRVWVGDQRIELPYRLFLLLQALLAQPGSVFSREALMRQVWRRERQDATRTVDVHIRRLRAALGPAAGRITTVRNVGYRFD